MTATAEPNAQRSPRPFARLTEFAEAFTSPLLPSDYLDLFAPLRAGAPLRGRVVSVVPETADAATLVIKPGADWAGHVPGQYLRIGVDVNGVRQWRAYSLTHGPRSDGLISITVKAVPDGLVSTHLVRKCQPGTLVHLEQAAGDFVLQPEGGKVLFITAGSGITPVIGMLRNLFPSTDSGVLQLPRSSGFDIVVVHLAPSEPDSIFTRDLRALAQAGAIRLVSHFDDRQGLFDVATLETLVPDLAERTTYACGPGGLLEAIEQHHTERSLPLYVEQFRTVRVAVGEGGTVQFNSGVTVNAGPITPILEAAEEAGVLMPSGCRMGICYGCVLPLREGAVRDLRNGAVTVAQPGDGVKIQTCISAAAGPVVLDH